MKTKYYNCPDPKPFDKSLFPAAPEFVTYTPNFPLIKDLAGKYANKKNLVVIGHGGSVSSFAGMYNSLREKSGKTVYFVCTVDPDYINEVKTTAPVEDTLVIAISKSGETTTQIEALMQFLNYELLFITGDTGPLSEIAKEMNAQVLPHPPIGGRYTGLTEVALAPAAICGFDVEQMYAGAKMFYEKYDEENEAYFASSIMSQLEVEQGVVDVFMPIYDSHLFYISSLIVQLCHESFGKDGKGQTYFAHTAPESQHHTNQRFFGGRKNIAGWFMGVEKSLTDLQTTVLENLSSITMKNGALSNLNNLPLQQSLQFEMEATIEDAHAKGIPVVQTLVEQRNESAIGELIAFYQLYAVYSSALRGVDPFDQPQVESSKKISFEKRLSFNK